MIPCHYCGGTPELRHYKADMGHFAADTYVVVCKYCGARTNEFPDPETVKLWWDREYVMELVKEEKEKDRYIEIDGKRIVVGSCKVCPCYSEVDKDGKGPWCKHPDGCKHNLPDLPGRRYGKHCPLWEVSQ